MLLCKYCNYYKDLDVSMDTNGNSRPTKCKVGICQYTGVIFYDDPENLEIEYPCNKK